MARKVKYDTNPANDYDDGYRSGRRYWLIRLKRILSVKKTKAKGDENNG